jgi:hypothetical protein
MYILPVLLLRNSLLSHLSPISSPGSVYVCVCVCARARAYVIVSAVSSVTHIAPWICVCVCVCVLVSGVVCHPYP